MVLDPEQSHHARDVLRLGVGTEVELFDDDGTVARGTIHRLESGNVVVQVDRIEPPPARPFSWIVASAVPKGQRADWMIEKLSELGTAGFVPLVTQRAVVLPEGKGKTGRWERIAAESAKQSRRRDVMRIEELTPLAAAARLCDVAWVLSTAPGAVPISQAVAQLPPEGQLMLLVGPEGGWTDDELDMVTRDGVVAVSLGPTVLRIETAAIAAAVIAALQASPSTGH